jgi:hypothetical protein
MRRGVRAPFVVTVAVATTGIACSDPGPINPPNVADSQPADTTPSYADTGSPWYDVNENDVDANPAECPSTDPGIGARQTCTAPLSVQCSYPDLCPSHPGPYASNVYACKDDGTGPHWTLISDAYTPVCPKLQPADGDPCPCTIHMAYTACNYGNCEDMTMIYAACKGIDTFDPVWHVKSITCNPPEPDTGFIDVTDDATSDAIVIDASDASLDE